MQDITSVNPIEQTIIYDIPFLANDHSNFVLWFFTGSRCNLECTHCYVESGPYANQHPYLTFQTFKQYLDEALEQKFNTLDIYFTGGEPFLNPDIYLMLQESLKYGNTTVLTNGTKFNEQNTKKLANLHQKSDNELTLRVSIDGATPEEHDKFRGPNAFQRTRKGVQLLEKYNLKIIITAMRSWSKSESGKIEGEFIELLVESGVPSNPEKLKILPPLRIGREQERSRPYLSQELFTETCFPKDYDYNNLQCSNGRMVSENGVWVCPILINEEGARMGNTLKESFKSFSMKYMACWTCRMDGMNCTN